VTAISVEQIPPLRRPEAPIVAAAENRRFLELVRELGPDDWAGWDVRAMAGHVLGSMEAWASVRDPAESSPTSRQSGPGATANRAR
jgi:hypothetical protein